MGAIGRWGVRAFAVALGFFALYLVTAYPTVSPYRDSGDLAASAITLGIAHPPGYPLYVIAGRCWLSLLQLGDPAFRLNVFSAATGAAALAVLLLALAPEGGLAATAAVLILGLAPAFWKLSLVSEMYALNALFASLIILTLRRQTQDARRWTLLAFLMGLGLANHQTLILLIPGLLFSLPLWGRWREAPVGATLLFLFLGLSVYLFLPLRSFQDPMLDWGEPHHLRGLWRVLTRSDYGGLRLHPERSLTFSWTTLHDSALVTWRALLSQVGWLVPAVALVGAWRRRGDPIARFCVLGFILSGPFFILLSNLPPDAADTLPILEPHLVLPLLMLAPLFAFGLSVLPDQRFVIPVALLTVFLAASQDASSHRFDFAAHDYEKNVLSALPKDSLLVDPDDPTAFTLSYFAAARGFREDVVPLLYFRTRWGYEQLHRRHPDVVPSSTIQSGHELYYYVLNYNLGRGRDVYADLPHKALPPYRTFAQGWAYRLFSTEAPPPDSAGLYRRSLDLWELSRARPAGGRDFFTVHALDYGASALNNLGVQALNDRKLDIAEAVFKRSLVMQPRLDQGWNNWGNVLYQKMDFARSAACYRIALAAKESPNYRYNLGRALMAGGQKLDAEKEMTTAAAGADIPDAVNDLGLLWLERGEAQRASDAFEGILRKHAGYRPAVYNLGLARAKLGLKDGAIQAFKAYRDSAQDQADKADAEAWLRKLSK